MHRSQAHAGLLLTTLLAGCAASEPVVMTQVRVVPTVVPSYLLTCLGDPAPPEPGASDNLVAEYLIELWRSGEDCRAALATVRARYGQ